MENTFAVVIGASSEIVLELTKKFAENGFELLIVSAVQLVKRILPEMKERGRNRILFTSSIASQMP